MRCLSLAAVILCVCAWTCVGLSDDPPKVNHADFTGTWKSKDHSLTIKENGLSSGAFKTTTGFVAGAFKTEFKDDSLFFDLTIGTEQTKWKLALKKDKNALVMEMVQGVIKRESITLTREGSDKIKDGKGPALRDDLKKLAGKWRSPKGTPETLECIVTEWEPGFRFPGGAAFKYTGKRGNTNCTEVPFQMKEKDDKKMLVFDAAITKVSGLPQTWLYEFQDEELVLTVEKGKFKGEYRLVSVDDNSKSEKPNAAGGQAQPVANPTDEKEKQPLEKPKDAEREANSMLKRAKSLLGRGNDAAARDHLERILEKYPKSQSAVEAEELLKKLKN